MSDIEKFRNWIQTYPKHDILGELSVDYTDQAPSNGGLFPSGLVEIERTEDLIGNVTVTNQYNFGLYIVLSKSPGDDTASTYNADWLMEFQLWAQEQSVRHLAPTFGNVDTDQEQIKAQNGVLYDQGEEGVGIYMIQISVLFKKYFEE